MTNDTIEVHLKGGGFTYDAKLTLGDTAEAEKARKVALFLLDLAAGEPVTPVGAARKPKRARADAITEVFDSTDPEAESL